MPDGPLCCRALYGMLLHPELARSNKSSMFLSLIYKAVMADVSSQRIVAFIKRLLQVAYTVINQEGRLPDSVAMHRCHSLPSINLHSGFRTQDKPRLMHNTDLGGGINAAWIASVHLYAWVYTRLHRPLAACGKPSWPCYEETAISQIRFVFHSCRSHLDRRQISRAAAYYSSLKS